MTKNLEPNKEKLILGTLNKPNTIKGIANESGVPHRTVKTYVERLVELGKVKDLKTYPFSYRRIPKNQWSDEPRQESSETVVNQIKKILQSNDEIKDPVVNSLRQYLVAMERGLTEDAALNLIYAAVEAFKQIVKERK